VGFTAGISVNNLQSGCNYSLKNVAILLPKVASQVQKPLIYKAFFDRCAINHFTSSATGGVK